MWGQPPSAVRSSEATAFCCVGCIRPPSRTLFLGFLYRHASQPMPAFTALLHARNDALRLGRALETLLPCDEILVVLHSSQRGPHDATTRIAREYGAKVVADTTGLTPSQCLHLARHEWILCLEPRESLTEALAASLFEWKAKSEPPPEATAFSVFLREETPTGWQLDPRPQTRLVPRHWSHWQGLVPAPEPSAIPLEGVLLRFTLP